MIVFQSWPIQHCCLIFARVRFFASSSSLSGFAFLSLMWIVHESIEANNPDRSLLALLAVCLFVLTQAAVGCPRFITLCAVSFLASVIMNCWPFDFVCNATIKSGEQVLEISKLASIIYTTWSREIENISNDFTDVGLCAHVIMVTYVHVTCRVWSAALWFMVHTYHSLHQRRLTEHNDTDCRDTNPGDIHDLSMWWNLG